MSAAAIGVLVLVLLAFALFLLAMTVNPGFFVFLIVLGIFAGAAISAAVLMKALEYCWNR